MDGDAGGLARGHQARHDRVRITVTQRQHLAFVVRLDAAHVVVHGRQHGDRFLVHIDTGEDMRRFRNARQAFGDDVVVQVIQVQEDVVGVLADAAPFPDLHGHGAGDDVPAGQVLGGGGIALHEALTLRIDQIAAFAAHAFGDQAARTVDAGGMELHELQILQRQARAQHHAATVAGAGVGRGTGEIGATIAAGGQDDHLRPEQVQGTVGQVPAEHAGACAFIVHDQVDGEILDEEMRVVLQRLAIERVQHGVTGTVGGGAGPLRGCPLTELRCHAAEVTLVYPPLVGTAERHAEVLQLQHRVDGIAHHVLDGVLVTQPVRPLDGVVHVPAPVVGAHVAQRGGDAALCRDRVRARREHLGDAGRVQPRLRTAHGGAQSGPAGTDHHHIELVLCNFVSI